MEELDEIDWLNLPRDARIAMMQKLYKAVSAVAASTDQRIDDLMLAALPVPPGEHDRKNFGKGMMAAAKAKLIHKYLEETHFELAQSFAPSLFQTNPKSAWDQFLEAHTIAGGLRVLTYKSGFGIVGRAAKLEKIGPTIRLGEEFVFELTSPCDGYAVAFQQHQGNWHPVPLGEDERRLRVPTSEGAQILPRTAKGAPVPLAEAHDTGPSTFVFIVSSDRGMPVDQKGLVQFARHQNVVVARLNVVFST